MSYCPKCGNKVDETMAFCPRCGAPLRAEATARPNPPPPPTYRRDEKAEKDEKNEKGEKHEKGETCFIGYFIAGIVVIAIGLFAYAQAVGWLTGPIEGAVILLIIGVAIILVAIWLSAMARRHYPAPPAI
jgi:hypothetical protein